ncbi:MAG: 2-hydroxyacyl-CoA dehydratase [Deltaproteobacteria bacterium]|nr:2-hydroxyacyl-CoA dehydratase [Deltaproteobacteria bacterium]
MTTVGAWTEAGLREAEVPILNLEVDCVDPRPFSDGQLKTRIHAFIEMLGDGR